MRAHQLEPADLSPAGAAIVLIPVQVCCQIPVALQPFTHHTPTVRVSCGGNPILGLDVELGSYTSDEKWLDAMIKGTVCLHSDSIGTALWHAKCGPYLVSGRGTEGKARHVDVRFGVIATLVRPDGRIFQMEGIHRLEKLEASWLGPSR